jgi:glycosyltransferase involved in cell wall biosynthesis
MKIAVCLPSLNEAKTIGDVAQIIDQGLSEACAKYPGVEAEIVNFDSGSSDDTRAIFLHTATTAPKKSFAITGESGKGWNIFEFCRYAVKHDIDYCLTIDSDLISIEPAWILSLLNPLISRNATYVTPLYERSPFEGSSTNHFAFPFIYALTGYLVRQPIAGDFAFTGSMARLFLENEFSSTTVVGRYGIDIFMTITVICAGSVLIQVPLGRKIHGSSFHKLEDMFPQIAAAALLSLKQKHLMRDTTQIMKAGSNIFPGAHFDHKNKAIEMKEGAIDALHRVGTTSWCSENDVAEYIDAAAVKMPSGSEMSHAWVKILVQWIRHYRRDNISIQEAEIAGNELLPFFVLRAVNFWLWAETVDASEADRVVLMQAQLLRSIIIKKR